MKRFVAEADRGQWTLLPECLDDFIDGSNPVRVVDAFVAALDLPELGFDGVEPAATGRPAYHPSTLLKLCIYGYLNRVQSSRRLEREGLGSRPTRDPGMRGGGDHRDAAEADDLGREGGWSIRQAGLRLSSGRRCVSLPRG
jgi:Transposase domain (DUF772)